MTSSSMATTIKCSLAILLGLFLGACLFDKDSTSLPNHQEPSDGWTWVAVAGYHGTPEVEQALIVLFDALDREGIRWGSAGSRGYTLSIDSRDLPRGREIVQRVVESYRLPVLMHEQ